MIHSIRARLTAWYSIVLALVLIAFGAITYGLLRRQIGHNTDNSLASTARELSAVLSNDSSETSLALRESGTVSALLDFRYSSEAIIIFSEDGREIAASHSSFERGIERLALRKLIDHRSYGLKTLRNQRTFRLLLEPISILGKRHVLAVMRSLDEQERTFAEMRRSMLLAIPLAVLIASGGGYLLARKTLAPVAAMSEKARAISAISLSERIAVTNPRDELGQLATTLNALLQRLEESFDSQRRFMADASHELRTPVAILQGEIDVSLSRDDREAEAYRRSLQIMHRSVRKLTRIVRDLFLLARGDSGQYPLQRSRFYLDETLAGTIEGFRTLAGERGIELQGCHPNDILMKGDEDLVQRMIGNLIDNAVKYTPSGGKVTVVAVVDDSSVRLEVRDNGSEIPAEVREHLFERFFRAGPSVGHPGAGLGLPIARWIAEAHDGRIWIESGPAGNAFLVTISRGLQAPSSRP
ncbi:MAG TPA: ATP-binding protein [Thermoanaerobaculia bacterium]|nr:ATP-binding protein [Thermoanaerobaculia bacterium]